MYLSIGSMVNDNYERIASTRFQILDPWNSAVADETLGISGIQNARDTHSFASYGGCQHVNHSAMTHPSKTDSYPLNGTYTCLLLLISMLWHRQAIFKSKGDKLTSSAECRIRTQGLRHLLASRLNACWQTDWAIEDQAKNLNSTAHRWGLNTYLSGNYWSQKVCQWVHAEIRSTVNDRQWPVAAADSGYMFMTLNTQNVIVWFHEIFSATLDDIIWSAQTYSNYSIAKAILKTNTYLFVSCVCWCSGRWACRTNICNPCDDRVVVSYICDKHTMLKDWEYFNGLVQGFSISRVLAMAILQVCTKPSICFPVIYPVVFWARVLWFKFASHTMCYYNT